MPNIICQQQPDEGGDQDDSIPPLSWKLSSRLVSLMFVGLFTILTVFLPLAFSQFCDSGYSDLNGGTPCDRNSYCQFHGGSAYQCVKGYCCKKNGFCSVNEISIGGVCHRLSAEDGPCIFTAQCQPNGLVCTNGFCRRETPYQNR
uniref:CC domain-containing protein n=1 Tax=Heterorhabditis bacteriophora TaxID=37862 RepID=A0A1I7XM23_HETBA